MPPQPDEVQAWLQKAANDLLSARILLGHDPPVLETACFHCSRLWRKCSKRFWFGKRVRFERVHSLTYLLDLCEGQDSRYTSIRDRAETLAPYAVEVRYPGEVREISHVEAAEALGTAELIWKFVLNLLPSDMPRPAL